DGDSRRDSITAGQRSRKHLFRRDLTRGCKSSWCSRLCARAVLVPFGCRNHLPADGWQWNGAWCAGRLASRCPASLTLSGGPIHEAVSAFFSWRAHGAKLNGRDGEELIGQESRATAGNRRRYARAHGRVTIGDAVTSQRGS